MNVKNYHGSQNQNKTDYKIYQYNIKECNRALDFCGGFYLTSDYDQVAKWAKLMVLRRGKGTSNVTVFAYEEKAALLKNLCSVILMSIGLSS